LSTLRKKKPSKSVEKAARSVKDSDDFVQHIANIANTRWISVRARVLYGNRCGRFTNIPRL